MKKAIENPKTQNVKPVQSEVPFKLDNQPVPSSQKQKSKTSKTNTMKKRIAIVKSIAPVKKPVPVKPAPKSIKRSAATKPKLSIVKDAAANSGKTEKPVVPVKGLQYTLRVVDDLGRKIEQRSVMIDTIDSIKDFKFTQEKKEGEYNGCSITFTDDSRKAWIIKDLRVIVHLAEVAMAMCEAKLEEIEKSIYLPKTAA